MITEVERTKLENESISVAANRSLEDLPGEIWKPVIGYENIYAVSNLGRVKSLDRFTVVENDPRSRVHTRKHKGRILTQGLNDDGYLFVGLTYNNKGVQRLVHRLVYQSFISSDLQNGDRDSTVNHKNTIKTDNRVENLELMSRLENTHDFYHNPDFENVREARREKLRIAATGVHQSEATIERRLQTMREKGYIKGGL